MSTVQQAASNPFALMMDPDAVFAAMARSERLAMLHSRVCRPLDKPMPTRPATDDAAIDASPEGADESDSASA